jgi:hypothetical protein
VLRYCSLYYACLFINFHALSRIAVEIDTDIIMLGDSMLTGRA